MLTLNLCITTDLSFASVRFISDEMDMETSPMANFACMGDAGILRGDICCEASCGTCGGTGCAKRGNGAESCCTNKIEAAGKTCSETGMAPCIVDGELSFFPRRGDVVVGHHTCAGVNRSAIHACICITIVVGMSTQFFVDGQVIAVHLNLYSAFGACVP